MIAALLLTLAAPMPPIVVRPVGLQRDFVCELRDAAKKSSRISGRVHSWMKYKTNDSGGVTIRSMDGKFPEGDYLAVARGTDLTFSNYLTGTDRPTRMALIIGEAGEASISVDTKSGTHTAAKTKLYVGFCSGDFTGIGSVK